MLIKQAYKQLKTRQVIRVETADSPYELQKILEKMINENWSLMTVSHAVDGAFNCYTATLIRSEPLKSA